MSVAIHVKNVIKKYGNTVIIPDLSLKVKEGEFFTLLGSSGCGKTTLLRMIAGFNSIEGGTIAFNDTVINQIPPSQRNIGMVFQNYAIFPHMTVSENIAFGLKNRKVPKPDIQRMVKDIMQTVQIEAYKDRMPERLSGGQQQRVALARAIVIQPDVLLMDEPLSNLDAKLRVEMRNAIRDIQNRVHITTVYVTHDQEEAMAISDRIAVMNAGVIQQIGVPQSVYQRPKNLFVATFIGQTNIILGKLHISPSPVLSIGDYRIPMHNLEPSLLPNTKEIPVKVSVRPEEFVINQKGEGLRAKIESSVFLGLNTHYFVQLEDGAKAQIIQESTIDEILRPGETVFLQVKSEKINIFSEDGNRNYGKGVQDDSET
jgi:iron(III) transport system ATP-binding protein